jgi:hypothetical protein
VPARAGVSFPQGDRQLNLGSGHTPGVTPPRVSRSDVGSRVQSRLPDAFRPPAAPLAPDLPPVLEVVSPYGRSAIGTINPALRRVQRIGGATFGFCAFGDRLSDSHYQL